ncbi:MAG: hypothetical protein AB1758_30420, partial [Candidatus Eremiobacterota bacterium]
MNLLPILMAEPELALVPVKVLKTVGEGFLDLFEELSGGREPSLEGAEPEEGSGLPPAPGGGLWFPLAPLQAPSQEAPPRWLRLP